MRHDKHDCKIPGDEIRSVRNYWGMSRREFGTQFNVKACTIYLWERDGVTCRNNKFDRQVHRIMKLALDLLGDDANWEVPK